MRKGQALLPLGRGLSCCNDLFGHPDTKKDRKALISLGFPVFFVRPKTLEWWRWAELNRRPKALHPRYYMLIPPLGLVLQQHGGPSAPQNQPVLG